MDGYINFQYDYRTGWANPSRQMETNGTKTFLGLHSHGFPNLFIISGPQGGGGQFNFTRVIDAHADYVVWMLKTLKDKGATTVDIKKDAENAYARIVGKQI